MADAVLGAAMANLIDRAGDGVVTSYLHTGWWPTFNLTEVSISWSADRLPRPARRVDGGSQPGHLSWITLPRRTLRSSRTRTAVRDAGHPSAAPLSLNRSPRATPAQQLVIFSRSYRSFPGR
ncbi:hypothetical protein [Nonomuraea guangzhouensis]|uniref:Uncharacterized protein n=1 Tax=Nonomuraea guangzhouensis TaxID=1291555 RepID=A0ABW4G8P1_9ACTN|nr:hypothetical protein [Nonomuraea guangzhouensis]